MRDVMLFARQAGATLAESLFVDSARVERPGTPDPLTGLPPMTLVYRGACKVQESRVPTGVDREAGGREYIVHSRQVHFRVGAFDPEPGLVVTIESAAIDPTLVGRHFRVSRKPGKSSATAMRLAVEDPS